MKKQYLSIKNTIESFVKSFDKNLKVLQAVESNFTKKTMGLKNNQNLTSLLKTISATIAKIKNEGKEAKEALVGLKKLFLMVK